MTEEPSGRRHRWPWLLLAAVLLALLLAAVWLSKEIERIRRISNLTANAQSGEGGQIRVPRSERN